MMTTISGGLGRQGISTTHDLNPRLTLTVAKGSLAEIVAPVLTNAVGILKFLPENRTFEPPETSFHPDD